MNTLKTLIVLAGLAAAWVTQAAPAETAEPAATAASAAPAASGVQRPDFDVLTLPGGRNLIVPTFRIYMASGYTPSARNMEFLATLKDKVSAPKLLSFDTTKNNKNVLYCRASFPVYGPNKTPFASLVEAAVNLELVSSGLVAPDAPHIAASLDEFDFSSFGGGKWTINATLSPEGKAPFTIRNDYAYPVSTTAVKGCNEVMNALPAGLEAFLLKLYSDPAFLEAMR